MVHGLGTAGTGRESAWRKFDRGRAGASESADQLAPRCCAGADAWRGVSRHSLAGELTARLWNQTPMRIGTAIGLIFACAAATAMAQEKNSPSGARAIAPGISVQAVRNPVDKSYVKM